MSTQHGARAHRDAEPEAPIGVLLVNLGTPDSPSVSDVRRYLREFLSDRRVVEVPRILWWPLLNGIILPLRGPKSAHAYSTVWTEDGSPLYAISQRQHAALARELGPRFQVELAMRYGNPSIRARLGALKDAGCERVIVLPMFPQYSNATSGSVYAEVFRCIALERAQLALTTVPPWYVEPGYVRALAERVRETGERSQVTHWVFSFHGVPQSYIEKGDPYRDHCEATARALASELGFGPEDWSLTFQSRFGREPWLQPYADEFVPKLAAHHKRVGITMPGFTADCLETIEEIGIRLRADFLAAGGEELAVAPALNESALLTDTLAGLVRRFGG